MKGRPRWIRGDGDGEPRCHEGARPNLAWPCRGRVGDASGRVRAAERTVLLPFWRLCYKGPSLSSYIGNHSLTHGAVQTVMQSSLSVVFLIHQPNHISSYIS